MEKEWLLTLMGEYDFSIPEVAFRKLVTALKTSAEVQHPHTSALQDFVKFAEVRQAELGCLSDEFTAVLVKGQKALEGTGPYACDYCGSYYGNRACCQRRYDYLTSYGEKIDPPIKRKP